MMALRRFLPLFVAAVAFSAGSARAEVRIMMRPAPGSPAAATQPAPAPEVGKPPSAAPGRVEADPSSTDAVSLRRSDADAPVSETAEGDAAPPPAPRRAAPQPASLPQPVQQAAPPPAPAAEPRVAAPAPADAYVQDRRAASLYGAAAGPAPVSAMQRRRTVSPGEFRERCASDGGLMQGGGKYGLCIIR